MKTLIVLEFPRTDYGHDDASGKFVFDFPNSKVGKILYKYILGKKYLGLNSDEYMVTFAYDRVPEILPSRKYKPVTKKIAKDSFERLEKKILEYKPDLIIPMGNIGLLGVTGSKGVQKKRGVPDKIEIGKSGFTTWMIPTFTIENSFARPETKQFIESDLQLAKTYLQSGESAFTKGTGNYELVTDFNRLQEIFNLLKTKGQDPDHPIAMDFETNSINGSLQKVDNKLSPQAREIFKDYVSQEDKVSAKPIILSLSWEESQGVAIPIEHKKAPWTKEQLFYLEDNIRALIADNRWIVGHNFKFDIRFCMDTIGLLKATNCMDTMLMFYVGVSEEPTTQKGLKALAYRYTTMGGYDRPLDEYKTDTLAKSELIAKAYYEAHDMTFRKTKYEKLINEVDGGSFNYEWIPLDVIYPYAAGDTDATLRIFNQLLPIIKDNKKWTSLIRNFYPALNDALCNMEHNGIKMNTDRADKLKHIYEKELNNIVEQIRSDVPEIQELEAERRTKLEQYLAIMAIPARERTDEDKLNQKILSKYRGSKEDPDEKIRFNPSSRSDSKYILYVLMGYQLPAEREYLTDKALSDKFGKEIDPNKVEWTDYKADKTALNYIADNYNSDFAKLLIRYSKVNTLMNNFIIKLPDLIDPNNLMHTRFIPTGTVTLTKVTK